MLEPGGSFIHFGQLGYHFEDPAEHLAADELLDLLRFSGFDFDEPRWCAARTIAHRDRSAPARSTTWCSRPGRPRGSYWWSRPASRSRRIQSGSDPDLTAIPTSCLLRIAAGQRLAQLAKCSSMRTPTLRSKERVAPDREDVASHVHSAPAKRRAIDEGVLIRAAAIFRAAGDPERLRILDRLCEGERAVSELAEGAGIDLPTVSQRLRVLRIEGLLSRRNDGSHIYDALADAHIADLLRSTLEHARENCGHNSPGRKDP
jgi:DNA-binding transcriptional ArsR family regulator